MGMISKVGRKRWRVRLTLWTITALLLAGSITMLYPFVLMLAGSTKSSADLTEHKLVPSFLTGREALWQKHVEGQFNESLRFMRSVYDSDAASFERLPPPREPNRKLADAWTEFLSQANLPPLYYTVGYLHAPMTKRVLPSALRRFRTELSTRFDNDLSKLNDSLGTEFPDWNSVTTEAPQYLRRSQSISTLPWAMAITDFTSRAPLAERVYFSIEGFYREQFLRQQYPTIVDYNAQHGTTYSDYRQVRLSQKPPVSSTERATWESFVRTTLNLQWLRADSSAAAPYRKFLQARFPTIDALNRGYGAQYPSFDIIPLIDEPPPEGLRLSDWDAFVQGWTDPATGRRHQLPLAAMRVHAVDFLFRNHLRHCFGSIEELNRALDTHYADFDAISPPQEDLHLAAFEQQVGPLRWEFATRNYVTVADYMLLHGRAVWNTIIYCVLAILGALIVNPLAAYALSRYKPPSTYKLLLVMMLTMAFPPMVTQIPVFLLLRDFGLLNSFWALVLPGLANGYSIFLLKGFFDSLPQELYESATLDGAGEVRIFLQITMSLSKPILAVIALSAFTTAYSNFMFALLLCQDQKMWTMMVWLYQLQARAGQGVIFASLTLAAIPTLIVFVACQRVIMRGIVVPVEK